MGFMILPGFNGCLGLVVIRPLAANLLILLLEPAKADVPASSSSSSRSVIWEPKWRLSSASALRDFMSSESNAFDGDDDGGGGMKTGERVESMLSSFSMASISSSWFCCCVGSGFGFVVEGFCCRGGGDGVSELEDADSASEASFCVWNREISRLAGFIS